MALTWRGFSYEGTGAGNQTSLTYAAVAIGAAASDRWVHVAVVPNAFNATGMVGVTIGGVTATADPNNPAFSNSNFPVGTFFYSANVPSGTTADVVASFSGGGVYNAWICVWTDTGEPTYLDAAIDRTLTSDALSVNVDVPADGKLLAFGTRINMGSAVWAGATEDADSDPVGATTASAEGLSSETGRAVTVTFTGGLNLEPILGVTTFSTAGGGPSPSTGSFAGSLPLSGSAVGSARVSGQVSGALPLSGTLLGAAQARGQINGELPLAGAAVGQALVRGELAGELPFGGDFTGQTPVQGGISGALPLAGSVLGTVLVKGTFDGGLPLTGTLSGGVGDTPTTSGSLAGELQLDGGFAGRVGVQGTVGGFFGLSGALSGRVAVQGSVDGALGLLGSVSGRALAAGAIAGVLPLSGGLTGVVRTILPGRATAAATSRNSGRLAPHQRRGTLIRTRNTGTIIEG